MKRLVLETGKKSSYILRYMMKIGFMSLLAGLMTLPVYAQQSIKVIGTVKDAEGVSLQGVNVLLKNSTVGVMTDAEGNYTINVPNNESVLQFLYVGYTTQEVVVGTRTVIDILMNEGVEQLSEIVVLGYGATARKADLSASIGIVENIETLKSRPVSGVTAMLQGQIPGVTVRNNGGSPTDGPQVIIRGQGSTGGESPLWVVDGVPGAPIQMNEVESIVILKDAASAAIYGAYSGASGVILVTTKRAKAGRTTVTYETNFAISTATNLPEGLTTEDQRRVREQSYANMATPQAPPAGWVYDNYPIKTQTNWIDEVFRTSLSQRHYVALSGGTETLSNKLAVQFNDNQGTLVGTYNQSLHVRYDASFKLNDYVRIREDASWTTSKGRGANTDSDYEGIVFASVIFPRSSPLYGLDGKYSGVSEAEDVYGGPATFGDIQNPMRLLMQQNVFDRPSNIKSSTFFDIIEPIKGLNFTSRFTYSLNYSYNKTFTPRDEEIGKPQGANTLSYSAGRSYSWETENTLNYDRTFGDHTIGALVSSTANQSRSVGFNLNGQNLLNEDPVFQYISYATQNIQYNDGYYYPDNNVAIVGRLAYSYANRYFLTGSFRRDYAGRLPIGKKYGDFPSFTAAWKLSEEKFFPKTDVINLIKFRGSWGRIGNLGSIGTAYGDQTLSTGNQPVSYTGDVRLSIPMYAFLGTAFNPFLTWETSETTDIGLDLDLLKNRLSLSVEWFKKRTFNLIKTRDLGWPTYVGISPAQVNEGEIQNTGLEFTFGWKDRISKDLSYFVSANLSTLENKVTDIGLNKETVWHTGDGGGRVGMPFKTVEGGQFYTYSLVKTDGLFQTDAEAEAYVNKDGERIQPRAKAGDLKFIDQLTVDTNDDGVPDEADGKIDNADRIQMDAYFPKITYALTAGLTYKKLQFSFMLQGVGSSNAFNSYKFIAYSESYGAFARDSRILNAWPVTNDIPRLNAEDLNGNFTTLSDWYLENAAYMRIKNISLSYSFDDLLRRVAHFDEHKSTLSLSLSIDNLYTFTKYSGMDPEVSLNGVDLGKYPVPRIFSIGLKLTY